MARVLEDLLSIDARTVNLEDLPPEHGIETVFRKVGYGPERLFFLCPDCRKAVTKLYLRDGRYLCRNCPCKLLYRVQSVSPKKRRLLRAQRVRRKLGGSENMALPFPRKPAQMSWARYTELAGQDREIRREAAGLISRED